ncbi:MAG: HEAT repeat domain-containing protein [Nitrospiraceae bacterium]|nr:HEAT repeat domain-containing protein [Nitrospiraceae bacterium]
MQEDFSKMIAGHMDAGFLENIIDMIKKDRELLELVPVLINDDRQRVRIGAVALVETFLEENRNEIAALVPSISAALLNQNPSVRADAIYMLSLIGGVLALAYLKQSVLDVHPMVREAAMDTIRELS